MDEGSSDIAEHDPSFEHIRQMVAETDVTTPIGGARAVDAVSSTQSSAPERETRCEPEGVAARTGGESIPLVTESEAARIEPDGPLAQAETPARRPVCDDLAHDRRFVEDGQSRWIDPHGAGIAGRGDEEVVARACADRLGADSLALQRSSRDEDRERAAHLRKDPNRIGSGLPDGDRDAYCGEQRGRARAIGRRGAKVPAAGSEVVVLVADARTF